MSASTDGSAGSTDLNPTRDAGERIVVDEGLWHGNHPREFPRARISFNKRKLQATLEMSGARRGAKVLEVGCTSGAYTFALRKLGFDVTGFDQDGEALDMAKRHVEQNSLENVRFEQGDAHDLSRFPDDTFDHVFSYQCYRYFSDLDRALGEVRRVLKPGGVTGIDYPNRLSPFYLLYKRIKGHHYHYADYNYLTEGEAIARHRKIGFTSVEAKTFLFVPPTVPDPLVPLAKGVDAVLEAIPWVNSLAGIVLIAATK